MRCKRGFYSMIVLYSTMTSNNKTILTATLVLTLVITLVGSNQVFAESSMPDKIVKLAKEGATIANTLEDPNLPVEKKKELETKFQTIENVMNTYGYYSPSQFNAAKQKQLQAAAAVQPLCTCPPNFEFINGFDYRDFGFWWGTAMSQNGWKIISTPSAAVVTSVTTSLSSHDLALPFTLTTIDKSGASATFTSSYEVHTGSGNPVYFRPYQSGTTTVSYANQPVYKYEGVTINSPTAGYYFTTKLSLISLTG